MKWIGKTIYFFAFAATGLGANEKNVLNDACGYVHLSSEQIDGLDAWNESKIVCIGADSMKAEQCTGLVVQRNSFSPHDDLFSHHDDFLIGISFENEEPSPSRPLIAERTISIGATRKQGNQDK
jgi:hypothetical protein